MHQARLNLPAIETALRQVKSDFPRINERLREHRDPMSETVLANMMAGYRAIDVMLASDVDLFALGNSKHLLDLNTIVLWGPDRVRWAEFKGAIEASERHFYADSGRGIGDLAEWWTLHRHDSAWRRAAGSYIRILSEPQLFVEGNHRTGALIMSYILVSAGYPPFVLSVDNAMGYFEPSSLIKRTRKGSLAMLFEVPKLKRQFAAFLKQHAQITHVCHPF